MPPEWKRSRRGHTHRYSPAAKTSSPFPRALIQSKPPRLLLLAAHLLADDGRRLLPPMTSLLPTPLLLLLLPLLVPALLFHLASASTLAISSSSSTPPTVCGVAEYNGTLLCAPLASTTSNASPVAPFLNFSEVSAGRDLVCGLRSGGAALFCWRPGAPAQLRRLYNGPDALADLAVGADHVAAYDAAARRILWWRRAGRFPEFVAGGFRSLVSGDGFSCAVQTNDSAVRCWGPRGTQVQAAFAPSSSSPNASYSYLAAGGTRACAVDDATGAVRCSGGSAAAVPERLFPYGLAVGDSHACGLQRRDRTAVCWSLGGATTTVYYPAVGTQFQLLVADGNSTCGVATADYSVLCWSSASIDATSAPLTDIRPGACVADEAACGCGGFLPQSAQFCAGSGGGGVCNRLCADASPPPVSPPPPPPPPQASAASGSKVSKRWVAFVVVGAVGSFAGLCSIVYCLVFGFCSNKRVHNSVQPNLTTTTTTTNNNNGAAENTNNNGNGNGGGGPSPYGSPNGSRARALFRRQLSRVMTRQRSGPSSFKDPAEEFSFAQLDAATKGFALETKIGEGSFGTVYRGKLTDGREVAIKRGGTSSSASPRRRRSYQEKESAFRSELAFLSRLHHKHLVGLVGYCDEDDERMLVYEYMKNGALFDHLHPKAPASSPPSPVMSSWKLRIKILLDASRGIEYLHSYAVPPIIHRDIKSSNILLDASWTARVSDFGLSLMGPSSEEEPPQQSQGGGMVVKAAGTVGYMDPEYYGLHHLTTKSDVYGFGVVMLETLTGKRAIFRDDHAAAADEDDSSPVVSSVVDHAVPAIVAGELARVLDPRAQVPAQPNEAEAVELVAYTAVHCVRLEGKDRPAMADIVANLETAFALCEGSDRGGAGGFGNSSSSASLSVTSMDRSGAL